MDSLSLCKKLRGKFLLVSSPIPAAAVLFSCKPPYSRDRRRRSPFFKLHGSGKGGKQKDLLTGREPIRMITRQSNHQSTVSSSRRTYLLQKNAMKSIQHRFSIIGFADPFPAERKDRQRSRKKGGFLKRNGRGSIRRSSLHIPDGFSAKIGRISIPHAFPFETFIRGKPGA